MDKCARGEDYFSHVQITALITTRFEQLVTSCRPREAYQLQHQINLRYGDVFGFDLLEEFSVDIWCAVMKLLSFSDLASCRVVRIY